MSKMYVSCYTLCFIGRIYLFVDKIKYFFRKTKRFTLYLAAQSRVNHYIKSIQISCTYPYIYCGYKAIFLPCEQPCALPFSP